MKKRKAAKWSYVRHSGAAGETLGVGTVEPFDAVGMLENSWRETQLT